MVSTSFGFRRLLPIDLARLQDSIPSSWPDRSGLADAGTGYPALGEIADGSNLSFLLNSSNYLAGTSN
jgi:hypothetical protein